MKSNLFSKHDNRHTVEGYGIYLGGRYGKKHMLDPTKNQQFSHCLHIHLGALEPVTLYNSTYASGYSSEGGREAHSKCSSAATECCSHSTAKAKKSLLYKAHIVPTKENFRRFPKRYSLPRDVHIAKPSVNAVWWSINSSQPSFGTSNKTPLSLLEASQQPYPRKNPWKYSYKQENHLAE